MITTPVMPALLPHPACRKPARTPPVRTLPTPERSGVDKDPLITLPFFQDGEVSRPKSRSVLARRNRGEPVLRMRANPRVSDLRNGSAPIRAAALKGGSYQAHALETRLCR